MQEERVIVESEEFTLTETREGGGSAGRGAAPGGRGFRPSRFAPALTPSEGNLPVRGGTVHVAKTYKEDR